MAEEWSLWVAVRPDDEALMLPTGAEVFLSRANATLVFLSWARVDWVYFFMLALEVLLFVAVVWSMAWLVGGEPYPVVSGKSAKPDHTAERRRTVPRALRPVVACIRRTFGCFGGVASDKPAIHFTLGQVMETAGKTMETFKIISVLFIFLSSQGIASYTCDTPSVLIRRPGWGVTTVVPSYFGGSKAFTGHLTQWYNYTDEEVHAVTAVMSSAVSNAWYFSLVALEVASITVTLGTWGALVRFNWAQLYGWVSLLLAFVWMGYETQQYLRVTLHDSGEAFMCFVPYLNVVSRSFTYLHTIIAAFYFGIAIGLGDCSLCSLCPARRGMRYCTPRHKRVPKVTRQALTKRSLAGAAQANPELGDDAHDRVEHGGAPPSSHRRAALPDQGRALLPSRHVADGLPRGRGAPSMPPFRLVALPSRGILPAAALTAAGAAEAAGGEPAKNAPPLLAGAAATAAAAASTPPYRGGSHAWIVNDALQARRHRGTFVSGDGRHAGMD